MLFAEEEKFGPETRRLSKKGDAINWGVYVLMADEGPNLSLSSKGDPNT